MSSSKKKENRYNNQQYRKLLKFLIGEMQTKQYYFLTIRLAKIQKCDGTFHWQIGGKAGAL